MVSSSWVLIAFFGIVAFGYWHWKRGDEQINALKASGFSVSVDLNGTPRLLLDSTRKEFAVVKKSGFHVYALSDINKLELAVDKNAQVDSNYRIALSFSDSNAPDVQISYENEWIAQDRLKTLQSHL